MVKNVPENLSKMVWNAGADFWGMENTEEVLAGDAPFPHRETGDWRCQQFQEPGAIGQGSETGRR